MTRTRIKGATVITMDQQGVRLTADILITHDTITDITHIAPRIQADDAEQVNATGCIVIPGLINAPMRTWQTALPGVAANWTLPEDFKKMHAGLATALLPEDLHIATLDNGQPQRFCERGMSFSAAAQSEMSQGHGHPLTGRLRALGEAPSLGVDLESVMGGDLLTPARRALGMQRSPDNVAHRAATGALPATITIPALKALSWVTVQGARMLHQRHRVGTIKAGK